MDWRQYLRHFAILLSGTAAAQVLNLAAYPLLARLYSPADFGGFAIFVAASAIPGAIACGRFELAVPTAPHWGRHAILWLCIALALGAGMLATLGAGLWWWWQGLADGPVMAPLLGLCVFLTGFTAAAQLYLMRHDRYRLASLSLVVRTGGAVLVQALMALVARDALSLVAGYAAGFLAQGLMLGVALRRIGAGRPHRPQMRALFRRYRRQVSIDIPSTFIAALGLNLMTFFLLGLFNQRTLGFYSLANRIAIVPLQLFNDALGQVFFQKAARSQERTGAFWSEMKFNVLTSGAISVVVLAGIWLLATPFVTIYLGREWAPSAGMLLILAPMLAMRSLCMSVATAVFVLRRPQWLLYHNLANAAVQGAAFALGWAGGLGVAQFLELAAALLFVEYLLFAAVLIEVARRGAQATAASAAPR
jgi:O-antigen/teichoic acid export membrane protein